jgi:hypothetical protein
MKDRVSSKILDNGAIRYGVYDENGNLEKYQYLKLEDEPVEEGSALNKANLLPDSVCNYIGIDTDSEPADALKAIAQIGRCGWSMLTQYREAGAYEWEVPDLYGDGKPYEIGVAVIGGGGGGTIATNEKGANISANGGASGYACYFTKAVIPSDTYNIVVGSGGIGSETKIVNSSSKISKSGKAGSTSSFDDATANGGAPGGSASLNSDNAWYNYYGAYGGQGADYASYAELAYRKRKTTPIGGETFFGVSYGDGTYFYSYSMGETLPYLCTNPFTGFPILAAGGSAVNQYGQESVEINGEYSSGSNIEYGSQTVSGGAEAIATVGTLPGCGGGATVFHYADSKNYHAAAAPGADGAVIIYVKGGVPT